MRHLTRQTDSCHHPRDKALARACGCQHVDTLRRTQLLDPRRCKVGNFAETATEGEVAWERLVLGAAKQLQYLLVVAIGELYPGEEALAPIHHQTPLHVLESIVSGDVVFDDPRTGFVAGRIDVGLVGNTFAVDLVEADEQCFAGRRCADETRQQFAEIKTILALKGLILFQENRVSSPKAVRGDLALGPGVVMSS